MGIHGTNPMEGLEEGSKEYLEMKKRLAQKDLESHEGEIRVEKKAIREVRKSFWARAATTVFAGTFAAAMGGVAYDSYTEGNGPREARAETACMNAAKHQNLPTTPEAISLCKGFSTQIENEKRRQQIELALSLMALSLVGTGFAGLRAYISGEELSWRKRYLKTCQSKAAGTREEIKGLDEQLRSFDLN